MPCALFAAAEVLVGANRKRERNQRALEWNGEVGAPVPHATCAPPVRHLYDASIVEMRTLWNPLVLVHVASPGDEGLQNLKGFSGF